MLVLAVVAACGQQAVLVGDNLPPPMSGSPAAATLPSQLPSEEPTTSAMPSASPAATPSPTVPVRPVSAPTPRPPRRSSAAPAQVIRNVAFTRFSTCPGCSPQLDVFVPAGSGPFPVVVLVRGGPSGAGGRSYLEPFAQALAARGVLVFNADMRDIASQGGGFPEAFNDVVCAIRYARAEAPAVGGEPWKVTLVGHSLGGYVASVVTLDADDFGSGCLAGGRGGPDAFVGLAGNYRLDAPEVSNDLAVFFGGSSGQTAAARRASDPFAHLAARRIPVRLVAGTADSTVAPSASTALYGALAGAGWDVRLVLVPGAGHGAIVDVTRSASTSVAAVLEATELAEETSTADRQ